jgi:hypothetical protein
MWLDDSLQKEKQRAASGNSRNATMSSGNASPVRRPSSRSSNY